MYHSAQRPPSLIAASINHTRKESALKLHRQLLIALSINCAFVALTSAQTVRPCSEQAGSADKTEILYDRFKDKTTLTMKPYIRFYKTSMPPNISMTVISSHTGRTRITPSHITLVFTYTGREWLYLNKVGRHVRALIGDERLDLGTADRASSDVQQGGRVTETLGISVPLDTFLKIVNADRPELQVGTMDTTLRPEHVDALRCYASQIVKQP